MSFRSRTPGYTDSYKSMHANRVANANPHELVSIMFEELLLKLDTAIGHIERHDMPGMIQAKGRAAAIVNALDESLDFEHGGDTAIALGVVYREASERLARAKGPAAKDILQSVRLMIAEIYSAWSDIGKAARKRA
ncbi:flagellar export chaperone FliS [Alterisphingorhabdus coralli]|uniref:Flagellar protein FliS n=1 Tax=Alterisphingorhabdus coralli TaxID=3071408 RepID=A0AA97HZJ8_9SPHN|nr:flagellar protein FliS [Parasphingorhabdus sp. SCSIO 66989]WOE74779.1 flagellar protein FliS [Parasphingorhabdus sp. SCSIO 66989]